MALYIAGEAGNKKGRPKGRSVFTAKGRVEAVWKKKFTTKQICAILDKLNPKEKADFALATLPYIQARVQADVITREEADELYRRLAESAEQRKKNGTAG